MKQFISEWVNYDDEDELAEANQYLILWMKFILKKIPNAKYRQHQFVNRDSDLGIPNETCNKTLGIKIEVEINNELFYEPEILDLQD